MFSHRNHNYVFVFLFFLALIIGVHYIWGTTSRTSDISVRPPLVESLTPVALSSTDGYEYQVPPRYVLFSRNSSYVVYIDGTVQAVTVLDQDETSLRILTQNPLEKELTTVHPIRIAD